MYAEVDQEGHRSNCLWWRTGWAFPPSDLYGAAAPLWNCVCASIHFHSLLTHPGSLTPSKSSALPVYIVDSTVETWAGWCQPSFFAIAFVFVTTCSKCAKCTHQTSSHQPLSVVEQEMGDIHNDLCQHPTAKRPFDGPLPANEIWGPTTLTSPPFAST